MPQLREVDRIDYDHSWNNMKKNTIALSGRSLSFKNSFRIDVSCVMAGVSIHIGIE